MSRFFKGGGGRLGHYAHLHMCRRHFAGYQERRRTPSRFRNGWRPCIVECGGQTMRAISPTSTHRKALARRVSCPTMVKRMTTFRRAATIVATLALFAGCGKQPESRPVLTKEVFFAAAKKCAVLDPKFTSYVHGKLPTVNFGELSPATGECVAGVLNNYQYGSMTIGGGPKK